MSKKTMAYLVSGLLILGTVTGLGTYKAWAANNSAPVTKTDTTQQEQKDEQNPSYVSSIRTNNPQDNEEVKGQDQDNEATESSSLQSLAKISPEDAKAAALSAVPGTIREVSLDNENGNVVYSIEVQTAKGITEVKIDAGNGKVLAQDSEQDNDKDNEENDQQEGAHGED
jgi:uncharacterized membrane protein YkoI